MREWEEQILSHIKNMLFYLVFLNVNIYIFNTTIVMIDDKKIEETARLDDEEYYDRLSDNDRCFFEYGFRRGYNQALKGLLHPASEVPRNDNGKVLAFSRVFCNRKLYNMNAMLDKTTCNTYQEMWEEQVYMFQLSDWIFVDELFDLITKGGSNERA